MRPKVYPTLLLAAVALAACLFAVGAHAQRGASRQANDNASGGDRQKRVVVGRGSDTGRGSRQTITADDSLKDYSAYRSGDRFYVVLPKSAAGGVRGGGGGKGYSDMQVQQRGDSVVLSYRVQPGAKPRVEQKFNRLDVVFDVAEGAQQSSSAPAQTDAGRPSQPAQNESRNTSTAGQQSTQAQSTQQAQNAAGVNERRPTPAESARTQADAAQTNAGQTQATAPSSPAEAAQGATALPSSTTEQPQESATPAASPSTEPQLAQAEAPAGVQPITTSQPASDTQVASTSIGTFLLRNWGLAVILAIIVVGVGLVFAARRTATQPHADDELLDDAATPKLDEPRAKPLAVTSTNTSAKTATPAATATPSAASTPAATAAPATAKLDAVGEPNLDATPLAAASALAGGAAAAKSRKQSRKEARQEAKRKKKGERAADAARLDETAAAGTVAEPVAEESAAETVVEETSAVVEEAPAAVEAGAVEASAPAVEVSELEERTAEVSAAEVAEVSKAEAALDAAVMEPAVPSAAEAESHPSGVAETGKVEDAGLTPAAAVLASTLVAAVETAIEPVAAEDVTTEGAPRTEAEEAKPEVVTAVEAVTAAEAVKTVTEIEPVSTSEVEAGAAPDHETVQAETRRLLEGEKYDRAVVGTRDPVARQMVASELLYVLAGRNEEKRKRAGAAFVEQGFYDEAARDLREADAPAERTAAARSLALLGDRKATPLLVNALEDSSTEVRRAAVEALGSLRDPAAVAPLEALLERERNERNRIPGRVILNAIQTCREGSAEVTAEAPAPTVEAPATIAETPTTVTAVEPFETESFVEERGVEAVSESAPEEEKALAVADERPDADEARAVAHDEVRAGVHEAQPLVDELQAAAESGSLEASVAEPRAVVETGIRPLFSYEAEEATREVAAAPTEVDTAPTEVGLEPVTEVEEESAQPTLFDGGAAVVRDIEPVAAVDESEPSAGEWFDLDVNEFQGAGQTPAADTHAIEPAAHKFEPLAHSAEPASHTAVFESSSGDAIGAQGDAEPPAFFFEPTTTRDAETARELDKTETARGLDLAEAGEHVTAPLPHLAETRERGRGFSPESAEKGIAPLDEFSAVPAAIQHRLASEDPSERAAAVVELSHVDTDEAFQQICAAFDDRSEQVRSAAARALYELRPERADSFTRALREATPERKREIGASISASGLAGEAISQLTGESREKTYEAFSLLFLMAKAGEVQPLVRAIESHPSNEVRLAVVKLLALSGQKEILPAFRRLAVRGSLPTEVRSAVMEAIYQISSSQPTPA